jgi:opacity protein-like surface antigen
MLRKSLCLIAFCSLTGASQASAEDARVEIHLNALGAWGDFDFSESRSFPLLGRSLAVTAHYDLDSALGIDGGVQVNLVGPLAIRGSVSHAVHDGRGTVTANVPPLPLPVSVPGQIELAIPESRVTETDIHVDAVLSGRVGRARLSAFGGVTFFKLSAELVNRLEIQVPGFGPVPVFEGPTLEVSDSPTGWNAGVGVDFDLTEHWALGAFARYSAATAELDAPGVSQSVELDAGGAHAGAGLRFRF